MIKRIAIKLLPLFVIFGAAAHAQTRNVSLSWTASVSAGVNGYNVSRASSPAGPFVVLNTTLVAGTGYIDATAQIGQTYTYQVVALANPCTATTPVGSVCGSSLPASATTTVPQVPAVTITVTIAVP